MGKRRNGIEEKNAQGMERMGKHKGNRMDREIQIE